MKKGISVLGILVLVFSPIVVAVVHLLLGPRWFPAGDMAQAELHMRGFFGHPPLVGAAGRIVSDTGFQGSHPGPSLWLAMLPIYLLGGRSSGALLAAAASVHIVSIAVILYLSGRRGGKVLQLAMAVILLLVLRSSGPDFMIEPWNPWLALLPFAVFVLLVAEVSDPPRGTSSRRDMVNLLACIAVGSHCLQSHAGYALLVVPTAAYAVVAAVRRRAVREEGNAIWDRMWGALRVLGLSCLTVLVVWLGPLIDQMRRKPGNLTILLEHFVSPKEPTLGVAKVWDILTSQLNVFGPWLLGPNITLPLGVRWIGFVGFCVVVGWGLLTAHRRGWSDIQRMLCVLSGFMALGSLSILRIFGPYFEYTVRWLWLLTAMMLAACVWCVTKCIVDSKLEGSPKVLRRRRGATALLFAGLVAISSIVSWGIDGRVELPGATDSRILAGLISDTEGALSKDDVYQIRFYDPYTLNATGFGLVLELERRGFTVKVDPEFAAAALPHRTAPMSEVDAVLWVVVGPVLEAAKRDPELELLASFNPRSSEEQERSDDLLLEVESGLRAAGRTDLVESLSSPGASILFAVPPLPADTAALVRELIRMGQPTGVFAMSPGSRAESLG